MSTPGDFLSDARATLLERALGAFRQVGLGTAKRGAAVVQPGMLAVERLLLAGLAVIVGAGIPVGITEAQDADAPAAVVAAQASAERSVLDAETLAKTIEEARRQWGVPGLAVAVLHRGRPVLVRGFGKRHTDQPEPVDADTLFAIASNTKAFTAGLLSILVSEGRLNWDDRVRQHLPWFEMRDSYAASDMRVRDLLCHRSGLGTFSGDLVWWGTEYQPRDVLSRTARLEPAHPFRAKYGYSNLMFLAAGEVVSAVGGQPWDAMLRERILQPLGMDRTIASVRDLPSRGNYATPHKTLRDRSLPLPWMNWDNMAAAGGIISSAADMSRWVGMLLRDGQSPDGRTILDKEQLQTLWQAHTPMDLSDRDRSGKPPVHFRAYGLGWGLSDYCGRRVIRHGGGYDGMYSQVTLIPEERLGIVVLTNSMTSISPAITDWIIDRALGRSPRGWEEALNRFWEGRDRFEKRIEKAIEPATEDSHPSHPLEDYAGRYRCRMYGDATVSLENERLVLRLLPNPLLVADLEHQHYDTFTIRWRNELAWFGDGAIQFIPDVRGRFHRLFLDVPNDDMWFYELDLRRVEEGDGASD